MFGRQSAPTASPATNTKRIERLEALVDELRSSVLSVSHVPPEKPRDGMLRFADGADWDPGSGAGFYEYKAGTWTKL